MQTLESLQRDMATAADLQAIVRTMKVLAAVSIRQYERALAALTDYQVTIEMGLQAVLRDCRPPPSVGNAKPQTYQMGAVVFGSDHGLCGRYNESLAAFALKRMYDAGWDTKSRRILAVGARMDASLRAMGMTVEANFFVPGSVAGITATVQQILLQIDNWQREGIEQVLLFYNAHQQRKAYVGQVRILLPVDLGRFNQLNTKPWPSRSLPIFTMDSERLLSALIRQHLFIILFTACAESLAGEHGSRLVSMQVAEKNIKERLEGLSATYRQQRQNQITEELLDVVSGFEALANRKK